MRSIVAGVLALSGVASADISVIPGRTGPPRDGLSCALVETPDGRVWLELRNESDHALRFANEPPMNRDTARASFNVLAAATVPGGWLSVSSGTLGPLLFGAPAVLPPRTSRRFAVKISRLNPILPPLRLRASIRAYVPESTRDARGERLWTGELPCGELAPRFPRH